MTTDPIIDMPRLRTQLVKLRDWIMTTLWWIFWLYLIREVFTIAVDLLSARSDELRMERVVDITSTFAFYFQIIVINGVVLILWARYNRFRFRGKDRRSAKSSVTPEEIAESLEMSVALVETAQRARRMVVHHDELGLIEQVEVAPGDSLSLGTRPSLGTGANGAGSRSRSLRPLAQGTRGVSAGLPAAAVPGAVQAPKPQSAAPPGERTIVSKSLTAADDEVTTVSEMLPDGALDDDRTTMSKPLPASDADDEATTVSKLRPNADDAPPR
jgi:biofilm PGA synthesis protein PgaD